MVTSERNLVLQRMKDGNVVILGARIRQSDRGSEGQRMRAFAFHPSIGNSAAAARRRGSISNRAVSVFGDGVRDAVAALRLRPGCWLEAAVGHFGGHDH